MVAISLYRGKLHLRLNDRPRQWPMPHRRISLRDFKSLTRRRSKALSLLPLPPSSSSVLSPSEPPIAEDPKPSLPQPHESKPQDSQSQQPDGAAPDVALNCSLPLANAAGVTEEVTAGGASSPLKSVLPNDGDGQGDSGLKDSQKAPAAGTGKAETEVTNGSDAPNDKEKRKKDLERKLQVLNERKHQLVQALKQILNAEEEMIRRSGNQMPGGRSGTPLHSEANAITKISAEGNLVDDLEGESEDASNQNAHARHMPTQCSSPSMPSPLRRPGYVSLQHSTASRGGLIPTGHTQSPSSILTGVTASPSRFAPPGHQGPALSLPPVSVSGSHFIASSPSPAASGGTSGFRDGRLTSPTWN